MTQETNEPDVPIVQPQAGTLRKLVLSSIRLSKRLALLEAVGIIVAATLFYLLIALAADTVFHLGRAGRVIAILGFISTVVLLTWWRINRWRRLRLSEDEVALAIEQRSGGVQNRLINALQLERESSPASAVACDAVVRENIEQLQNRQLPSAARPRAALICVALALIAVGVAWLWSATRRAEFMTATRRIFRPLADIDPLYRTRLEVQPGNLQATDTATIQVVILGERPSKLTVYRDRDGQRTIDTVAVPPGNGPVTYVFRNLRASLDYSVRGNDYTSPTYKITVNSQAELSMAKATLHFPEYTKVASREVQSNSGDLEALIGTRAAAVFVFDRPVEKATLILSRQPAPERIELKRLNETEFAGEFIFKDVAGYQLETGPNAKPGPVYALRVLADGEPKAELSGLERESEVSPDATLNLRAVARDDFGLDQVGLFSRKAGQTEWTELKKWPGNGEAQLSSEHSLAVATLGAVEGDRFELLPRASDTDPLRKGAWIDGTIYTLVIGGEGTALQLAYERILQSDRDLAVLLTSQDQSIQRAGEWLRKLDPDSGLRWDDKANIDALANEMKEQAKLQETLRQQAGNVARGIVSDAGDLRLSVGLLADAEMVRGIRLLEAVPGADSPQTKRSALADARLTQERITRSLRQIIEQHRLFREEWELTHMVPFVKMLADRQLRLREESGRYAEKPAAPALADSVARREAKMIELTGLASTAFAGMGLRMQSREAVMAKSFQDASGALVAADLKAAMQQSSDLAKAGSWNEAAVQQEIAATKLAAIHEALKKVQSDLAKAALEALQAKAKSDAEAQKEIERLMAGTSENLIQLPENLSPEEILHMMEVAGAQGGPAGPGQDQKPEFFKEEWKDRLQLGDDGRRQTLEGVTLAKAAMPEGKQPGYTNLGANSVKPVIQEKVDDLIGKLLDEAETLSKDFDTILGTLASTINEQGDVGKRGGNLNSTAAAAFTGNQKPPSFNVGGISRTGRQGARSYGQVLGDESVNRAGRTPQEGQERAPDQAGVMKEKKSENPEEGASTGTGGKKVEGEDPNAWNTSDVGKFTPDVLEKMGDARDKAAIVERQDGHVDAKVGELLRDMNSRKEQVVERIKALRKELNNLYLPTEHLDDLVRDLNASMSRLQANPDAEAFRQQQQTLDKLQGTMRVFGVAQTGIQPSLPREQLVRGPVLDEAPRQPIPGYEDVVKTYYEMLTPLRASVVSPGTVK